VAWQQRVAGRTIVRVERPRRREPNEAALTSLDNERPDRKAWAFLIRGLIPVTHK
jgi:hypothetical protein